MLTRLLKRIPHNLRWKLANEVLNIGLRQAWYCQDFGLQTKDQAEHSWYYRWSVRIYRRLKWPTDPVRMIA
jgi:hypothetical protein